MDRARGADARRAVALARRPVVGYQRWDELLFLHWDVDPGALRPLVDPRLELDLRDGRAWLSLTPFTLRRGRTVGDLLLRVRVRHPPWRLREASVADLEETLSAAAGVPPVGAAPLARCSRGVDVAVLAPELVSRPARGPGAR